MATLEEEFRLAAIEMITETFGPGELPSSNKPAQFITTNKTGYRNTSTSTDTTDYCIRIQYTSEEFTNNKLDRRDVRFVVLAADVALPFADDTEIVWDGVTYTVVNVDDVSNIIYDIQARRK